jgi:hypothetical protein
VIPLPSFLATPLRALLGLVALIALGAGAVYGWRYLRNRDEKQAIESKPAIVENQRAIDTATATNVLRSTQFHTAAQGFRRAATAARANPATKPETQACYDAGVAVISRCDSLHTSDSTLITLYKKRADLMEAEAIRARRGRLIQFSAAGGYDPLNHAPTARVGVELNFSTHWSGVATGDISATRDTTRRSAFVGLNYRFGGRNP